MKRLLTSLCAGLLALTPLLAQQTGRRSAVPDKHEQHMMDTDKDFSYAVENYYRYWNQAREEQDAGKVEAFTGLRQHFQKNPWRIRWAPDAITDPQRLLDLLTERGTFSDMDPLEDKWRNHDLYNSFYRNTPDDKVGIFIGDALRRVFLITEAYRTHEIGGEIPLRVYDAILHYGGIEIRRSNLKPRFHASCFAIPAAAANIYFSLLDEMDRAETSPGPGFREIGKLKVNYACKMLKALGLQAWTQPMRRDETDSNVVSLARFRNHVWWVGGNALAYRPLLPVAAMFSSVPMVDLLAEVCQKCISSTSQVTYNDAFWTEGFTADGAGWGHGKQCLIWGYPIDGTSSALAMLQTLNGTPWEQPLSKENTDALMNFFRGGSWYWYKGWRLPGLDRNSYKAEMERYPIAYAKMLKKVLSKWSASFTEEELAELRQLDKECDALEIDMEGQPDGHYSGMRWFFNNDDFMKKTPDCHVDINMASYRCDGLESAPQADNYNFTCTDGATLLQRDGNEYFKIMGAWDVTLYPGVTARQGMDKLTPVTNWRGYCSQYNFAAAAHDGKNRGVAGLLFEKMDGNDKKSKDAQDGKTDDKAENSILYGLKAHKSWFFIDDYMVALGAGITAHDHVIPGQDIFTTIDQTALEDEVWMYQGRKKPRLIKGSGMIPDAHKGQPVWISQKGKFSYCLIPGMKQLGSYSLETRPNRWIKMNRANKPQLKSLPEEADILTLKINHTDKPVDAKYAYCVYLGKELPKKALRRLPFEVVRNDHQLQAVQAFDGKLLQAVFYPSKLADVHMKTFYKDEGVIPSSTALLETGKEVIRVSHPCVLMIDRTGDKPMLYITDATMNASLKTIEVTIGSKEYRIPMPQGDRCGDTVAFPLDD